jgi:hypothetical protein
VTGGIAVSLGTISSSYVCAVIVAFYLAGGTGKNLGQLKFRRSSMLASDDLILPMAT